RLRPRPPYLRGPEPERRRGRWRRLPHRRRAHEAPHGGGASDAAEGRKTAGSLLTGLACAALKARQT
ncbi:hypothetical protein ACQKI4_08710, partial [Paenibacillus glucanolyticus]|uniref:hypothetical protein n=1 Tax=Paenibacillus glucanolyticus TaxID=59843 RepID=UPI003CFECBDB